MIRNVALLLFAAAGLAQASDPYAVYARVERVVLEPSPQSSETIRIYGVFAIAKENHGNEYLPPARRAAACHRDGCKLGWSARTGGAG